MRGAQVAEQSEDLGLDGDVEGGGGLVGDEQAGAMHERHGDEDALALPAGELVGIVPVALGGIWNGYRLERGDGPAAGFAASE